MADEALVGKSAHTELSADYHGFPFSFLTYWLLLYYLFGLASRRLYSSGGLS